MANKDVKKDKPLKPFGYKKLIEQSGMSESDFLLDLLAQYKSAANAAKQTNISRQTIMKRLAANNIRYTGTSIAYVIEDTGT